MFEFFSNKYYAEPIPQFEYPEATCFVAICDSDRPIVIKDYFSGDKDRSVAIDLKCGWAKIFLSPTDAEWFIRGKRCGYPDGGYILGVNVSPKEIRAIIQSEKGFGNQIAYAIEYCEVIQTRGREPSERKDPCDVIILRPSNNPSSRSFPRPGQ